MNIHIAEPWWGAYVQFGWGGKIPGIGFKKKDVLKAKENNEKILVTVGKDPTQYQVSPVTVLNQVKKYKSTYKARFNTVLLVIPQSELEKVND